MNRNHGHSQDSSIEADEHPHDHPHSHDHSHSHPTGIKGVLYGFFVPHTHDAADTIDDALEANAEGIRTLKISLVVMLATTVVQAVIVAFSGSVALLADTIHNLSDALTAVPLWIAFALSRRVATRKFSYGFNRAEDLAGLFIVLMIALSSIIAAYEAIDRMIHPRPMEGIGWVIGAGAVGFLGNETVALYRIRVGRRIGSAALVADGVHARTDGFTSLAVVAGAVGVMMGFPLADPIVGLLISAMIAVLLVGTVRSVGRRLMDGVEPELIDRAEDVLRRVAKVDSVERVRMRWIGHRLHGDAVIRTKATSLADASQLATSAEASVKKNMPNVDEMAIRVTE